MMYLNKWVANLMLADLYNEFIMDEFDKALSLKEDYPKIVCNLYLGYFCIGQICNG